MKTKKQQAYFDLGNELKSKYTHLNFENHCYWRIALDNTLGEKWKNCIASPAYKNLKEEQLEHTIALLKNYLQDEALLIMHNEISLGYRGKN